MKLIDLLKNSEERFRSAGFDSPEIEAAYMLEEVTGIRHNLLWTESERGLSPEEQTRAEDYMMRRLAHEPFQYICGWEDFRELKLNVAPGCLIPRPETELLVDFVLKALPRNGHACELGTGSGAIALSIAKERPDSRITASEISPDALAIAESNRKKYGLNNVSIVRGDLFASFDPDVKFDLLVANLPYIPEAVRDTLPRNVRDYEPSLALFADHEGMALIERALLEAPRYLKPGAPLFFEMGEEQGAALAGFARTQNCYTGIKILQDQYGVDRFLACIFAPDTCKKHCGTV
ncbi:MAG: peptide chain release factor N(5)-glutamine methyltransferase [Lentisphaerae bacterium]|nr:peptide chain release factor N(5)-glutamine methyltransferase [Lentisphaerota bacterium]